MISIRTKKIIMFLMCLGILLFCFWDFSLDILCTIYLIFFVTYFNLDVIKDNFDKRFEKMERKYILKHCKWLI